MRRTTRLELERLEGRDCPAVNTWTGPAGGLWSTPANWSLGHAPAPTDAVVFSQTHVADTVVDGAYAVQSVTVNGPGQMLLGYGTGAIVGPVTVSVNAAYGGGHATLDNLTVTAPGRPAVMVTGAATVLKCVLHTGPGLSAVGIGVSGVAARALVQGCDLSAVGLIPGMSNPYYGLVVTGGAVCDAGQGAGGTDFTGMGVSVGGNVLHGYQGYAGVPVPSGLSVKVSQAIMDLNTNPPNNAAGPKGTGYDLEAVGNDFGTAAGDWVAVELLIYHDADFAGVGYVNYGQP